MTFKTEQRPPIYGSYPDLAVMGDVLISIFGMLYLSYSFGQTAFLSADSPYPPLLFFANGLLALVGFYASTRKERPLFVVFFLFNFLFLSVAPLQQAYARTDQIFSNNEVLAYAALMSIIFNAMGLIFLTRFLNEPLRVRRSFMTESLTNSKSSRLFALLIISSSLTCYFLAIYGSTLFTNRQNLTDLISGDTDKGLTIFLYAFAHPFIFTSSLIGLMISIRQKSSLLTLLFAASLCGAFIVNNPFVQARFRSSTLIVFTLLVIYGWRSVRLITSIILFGIAASPIYNSLFRLNTGGVDQREFSTFFTQMDFDAVNIFGYTILWVADRGLEFGSNIFGAFLFFVPRSLWEDKGKHVGSLIFSYLKEYRGYTSDNLSSPPPVEGYLSFGFVGAVLISLLVVATLSYVERRGARSAECSPWQLILCLSPMLVLILLRGPLQVGVSEWALHTSTIFASAVILRAGTRNS